MKAWYSFDICWFNMYTCSNRTRLLSCIGFTNTRLKVLIILYDAGFLYWKLRIITIASKITYKQISVKILMVSRLRISLILKILRISFGGGWYWASSSFESSWCISSSFDTSKNCERKYQHPQIFLSLNMKLVKITSKKFRIYLENCARESCNPISYFRYLMPLTTYSARQHVLCLRRKFVFFVWKNPPQFW